MKIVPIFPALFALACAPTYHRASPYRFDHYAAADLEERAWKRCEELGFPAGEPSEPFRTDGCSMWPDGMFTGETWQRCCVDHDMAYWCGGTRAMRRDADRELHRCVGGQYRGWMGAVMHPGAHVGGAPYVPAYWRWGYGHKFPKGYAKPAESRATP